MISCLYISSNPVICNTVDSWPINKESLTEYVQCHTECDAMAIERMQPGLLQRPEPMDLFESLLKTGSFVEAARLCHVMTPDEFAQAMTIYGQMKHSYRAIKLNDLYKAHKASIQTMSVRTEKFVKSIANYSKVVAVSCLDEPQDARLNVLVKHRWADLQLIALTDLEVFILSQLEVHLPGWRFTTLEGYNMEGFVSMHLYDDTTRTLACDVCHHVAESQLRGVGNICLYHLL